MCVSLWFSLVFAWFGWKIEFKITDNIFVDDANLNRARVYISSKEDLTDMSISWECWVESTLVEASDNMYAFDVIFNDSSCKENNVKVYFEKWNISLNTNFRIISNLTLYKEYIDYPNEQLLIHIEWAKKMESNLSLYDWAYKSSIHESYIEYLIDNRKLKETRYLKYFINDILLKREAKYLIPVKWVPMATKSSKLPNSWRPYRASYTDWVHEWWDFDTSFGNTVSAIDYWIVVRVVNNFTYSDIWKVKDKWEITDIDRMWNLDTLRWNQIWLKTIKWDIVFYAHLNEVFDNIKEWEFVFRWQPLWTVWISWVPDKNYSDYHLHLEVRKTPYEMKKLGYNFEDYMSWPWYFKWESEKYIIENQYNLFEKNE